MSNDEKVHEIDDVHEMLSIANQHGMEVEVVLSFGLHVSRGESIPDACRAALGEWDI